MSDSNNQEAGGELMTITNIPYTYECRVCDDEGSETGGNNLVA